MSTPDRVILIYKNAILDLAARIAAIEHERELLFDALVAEDQLHNALRAPKDRRSLRTSIAEVSKVLTHPSSEPLHRGVRAALRRYDKTPGTVEFVVGKNGSEKE